MADNAHHPKVRQLFKPLSWDRHHIQYDILEEGVDSARGYEWILTNRLGGYSSQSVSGENTRIEHGLLVAANPCLERIIFLEEIAEFVNSQPLAPQDPEAELSFEAGLDMARFVYSHPDHVITKTFSLIQGQNTLLTSYEVKNKADTLLHFEVAPSASIGKIGDTAKGKTTIIGDKAFSVKSEDGCTIHYCSNATLAENKPVFTLNVESAITQDIVVITTAGETEESVKTTLKQLTLPQKGAHTGVLGDKFGSYLMSLLSSTQSFIIDLKGKKTIIPGYHNYELSSRDALISLPGVCLIRGDVQSAEKILELHLNQVWGGKLPSTVLNKKIFKEFDAGLWLIDRVNSYVKAVNEEGAKAFLHTYWWTLKDVINHYLSLEKDGILRHKGGTWLGDERENAVEVQGLWYNSLRIMEDLSEIMEDDLSFGTCLEESKKAFDERYWNGSFLNDCEGDNRLRPSQVLVLSLNHSPVENVCAMKILSSCERKLLTPVGLRTLSPDDPGYIWDGTSITEGASIPWLLGPFAKAYVKHFREGGGKSIRDYLTLFFEKTTSEACLGTVSHHYSGDKPFTPKGCVSYAPSVAEPLRAYFEDVLQKKEGVI